MSLLKGIATLILAFVVLSVGLKLAFGLLGLVIGLAVLVVKLALLAGALYLLYSGFKALTA